MLKPDPRATYKYTDTFKATAVELNQLPGVASKDAAELSEPGHPCSENYVAKHMSELGIRARNDRGLK